MDRIFDSMDKLYSRLSDDIHDQPTKDDLIYIDSKLLGTKGAMMLQFVAGKLHLRSKIIRREKQKEVEEED
jgi:hypothetical protein